MKRVNCLYRVSSKQQLHNEDIPVQRAECRLFISKMQDWKFNKEYLEPAVSGFKLSIEKRKVLQTILEEAKNKEFDVLLVYMSDRIGRKEDETPAYVSALTELGVEVWSVKEGELKTKEHIDKLLNYIRFWQAEGESRKTGMRVRSAQETMVKAGKFTGGNPPYGYKLIYSGEISNHGRALKKLVINEDEGEIVKLIYAYACNYGYGAYKIAKVLNEKGIVPINDNWKSCTISKILKNPIYKGYLSYYRKQRSITKDCILSDEKIPELVIIPEEAWDKAQEFREKRKEKINTVGEYVNGRGSLTLSGLIYCGCCKCSLTNGSKYDYKMIKDKGKEKKIIRRYRCINKANATLTCTGKAYYDADEIEEVVYSVVRDYLNCFEKEDIGEEVLRKLIFEKEKRQKEIDHMNKRIDRVKKDIEILEANIPSVLRGEIPISIDKLTGMIADKKQELHSYEKKLKEKDESMGKFDLVKESALLDWGKLFMESSISEKKVVLGMLIERIEVLDDSINILFKTNLPRITDDGGTTLYRLC